MALQKYLEHYAESEAGILDGITGGYDYVICIPAFAEPVTFLETLLKDISGRNILVILVVNASDKASKVLLQLTRDLLNHLTENCALKSDLAENLTLREGPHGQDLLLVDRCTPGYLMEDKSGVGHARKIACDIACQLIHDNRISTPWIHTTDADAQLPPDYLDAINALNPVDTSAGLYPFKHSVHANPAVSQAQQLYDLSLHYYVHALTWAGSPWAFHTIGSTLVINALHYAQARGFPKREAGEDFYLLNKLGKIGRIVSLESSPITLECRQSDRVPFGTGPALNKILALENPNKEFLFYHPRCFVILKSWHELSRHLWDDQQKSLTVGYINRYRKETGLEDAESGILLACLDALGIQKPLAHAFSHSTSKKVFDRHIHNWFDAFQTLKFIHWLRNTHYPSQGLPLIQTEQALPFVAACSDYAPELPAWNRPPQ